MHSNWCTTIVTQLKTCYEHNRFIYAGFLKFIKCLTTTDKDTPNSQHKILLLTAAICNISTIINEQHIAPLNDDHGQAGMGRSSNTTTTTDSSHQERMEALKSLNQVVSSRGRRVSAGPQWSFEGEVPNTKAVPTQYSHQQVKRGRWGGRVC